VVDGDFLAHVSSLRVLRCCCHFRSSGTVAYVDAKVPAARKVQSADLYLGDESSPSDFQRAGARA
jgi:hypothetical protein